MIYHQTCIDADKVCKSLDCAGKRYDVLVFLIVHPRKSTGVAFDNDDVAGSSNITNLVDVVIRYGKPKDNDKKDSTERILSVYKNRLNGRTNRDGIKLYFQESSKRISETQKHLIGNWMGKRRICYCSG